MPTEIGRDQLVWVTIKGHRYWFHVSIPSRIATVARAGRLIGQNAEPVDPQGRGPIDDGCVVDFLRDLDKELVEREKIPRARQPGQDLRGEAVGQAGLGHQAEQWQDIDQIPAARCKGR